ncbi:hypothetical protein KKF63_02165 [bacterium]|nr:hypothetical protein [bacterium]
MSFMNALSARSSNFMRMPFHDYPLMGVTEPANWVDRVTLDQAGKDMKALSKGTLGDERRAHITQLKEDIIARMARIAPSDTKAAQDLITRAEFLDPKGRDSDLNAARGILRGDVFKGELDKGYSECFPQYSYDIAIRDNQGQSVMAGFSRPKDCKIDDQGKLKKPSDDCAAIGRAIDGAEFMIVCDGLGHSHFSHALAEVVSQIVAAEMAQGNSFGDGLNKACAVWRERQFEMIYPNVLATIHKSVSFFGTTEPVNSLLSDIWAELVSWLDASFVRNLINKVIEPLLSSTTSKQAFLQELENELFLLLEQTDPKTLISNKPSRTTIVGAHKYKKDGKTYAALYSLGDSDARLYKKLPDGSLQLVAQNKPHSFYECRKETLEPLFRKQAEKLAKFPEDVEPLKRRLIRNHNMSYALEACVNPANKQQPVADPVIKELEEGVEYVVMVASDYYADNLDDVEIEIALGHKSGALESLEALKSTAKRKQIMARRIQKEIKKAQSNIAMLESNLHKLRIGQMPWLMGTAKDTQQAQWEKNLADQRAIVEKVTIKNPFKNKMFKNEDMTVIDGSKDDDKTVWIAYWRG